MTISLFDFLLARLDEDAQQCVHDGRHWSEIPNPLFSSARMLVEIAAKRRAIAVAVASLPSGASAQVIGPFAMPYNEHPDYDPDWSQWACDVAAPTPQPLCGATATCWPDDEACEAECNLTAGHGGTKHRDEILGEWDESELNTHTPERGAP